jgi:hypothetical protein
MVQFCLFMKIICFPCFFINEHLMKIKNKK